VEVKYVEGAAPRPHRKGEAHKEKRGKDKKQKRPKACINKNQIIVPFASFVAALN
jgi:hypothetical protein